MFGIVVKWLVGFGLSFLSDWLRAYVRALQEAKIDRATKDFVEQVVEYAEEKYVNTPGAGDDKHELVADALKQRAKTLGKAYTAHAIDTMIISAVGILNQRIADGLVKIAPAPVVAE